MKNVIAIVTARSGSKGVPNKNIEVVAGKSLIEHAIAVALASKYISKVYISTDSEHYENIAIKAGALSTGLRRVELSSDKAKTTDVLIDFCKSLNLSNDTILVLLQPTSPIRCADLIDKSIEMTRRNLESTVSVAEVDEPHPVKLKIIKDGALLPFVDGSNSEVARQELPKVYQLTGAVYVSMVGSLISRNSLFSAQTNPVFQSVFANIDSFEDLDFLRFLIQEKKVDLE